MPDQREVILTIAVVAAIVYATRLGGYLLGLQVRHIGWIRPVLETLPGCALMAILVPALRRGNLIELAAMLSVVGIMWKTDNVIIATVTGMSVLIFGEKLL